MLEEVGENTTIFLMTCKLLQSQISENGLEDKIVKRIFSYLLAYRGEPMPPFEDIEKDIIELRPLILQNTIADAISFLGVVSIENAYKLPILGVYPQSAASIFRMRQIAYGISYVYADDCVFNHFYLLWRQLANVGPNFDVSAFKYFGVLREDVGYNAFRRSIDYFSVKTNHLIPSAIMEDFYNKSGRHWRKVEPLLV